MMISVISFYEGALLRMSREAAITLTLLLTICGCGGDTGPSRPGAASVPNMGMSQPPRADWSRFHEYGFVMWTPPGYSYQAMESEDSFMGAFEGEQVYVLFDFGWYSDLTRTHRGKPGVEEIATTVDGDAGFIWKMTDDGQDPYWPEKPPREPLPNVIILNIPKISGSDNGLWIRVRYRRSDQEAEILDMLHSITFPTSK